MKTTEIKFKGNEYKIQTGKVFQIKLLHGKPNTIFIAYGSKNEKVYIEILEKISNDICLARINEIQWEDNGEIKIENYNNVIVEDENNKVVGLDNMTKKELLDFISEHNLNVNTKLKKSELLSSIKFELNKL